MSRKYEKTQITGLKIVRKKGLIYPFLICQRCSKRIVGLKNGMVFWNDKSGVVAHKDCMAGLKDNRELYSMSGELGDFIGDLIHNLEAVKGF